MRWFLPYLRRGSASVLLSAGLVASAGCDRARVFEENHDFKDYAWRAEEKPEFRFVITDTAARYVVNFNVRTATDYPFYNLFVKLKLSDSAGHVVSHLRHELNVRDPQTGRPLGDGLGDIFDQQVSALRGVRFAQAGTYHVEVEQNMRLSVLPQVMAVGVRIAREAPSAPAH